jgi:hypothetical protein
VNETGYIEALERLERAIEASSSVSSDVYRLATTKDEANVKCKDTSLGSAGEGVRGSGGSYQGPGGFGAFRQGLEREGGGWRQMFGVVLDALKRLVGRSAEGERRGSSLTPGAGIRFLIVYPPSDPTLLTCLVRIRCDGEQAFALHEPCALVPAPT